MLVFLFKHPRRREHGNRAGNWGGEEEGGKEIEKERRRIGRVK